MMEKTVINDLEDEWSVLAKSPSAKRHMRKWDEPCFEGLASPSAVVSGIQTNADGQRTLLVSALLARAPQDQLAARIMLQTLLPGACSLAKQYRSLGDANEVAAMTIAVTIDRIRSFPEHRQTESAAGSILLDVRNRLHRERIRQEREAAFCSSIEDLYQHPPNRHEHSASEELLDVVVGAVRDGDLSASQGGLIIGSRMFDRPLSSFDELNDLKDDSRRRIRARAVGQLRRSVESAEVEIS